MWKETKYCVHTYPKGLLFPFTFQCAEVVSGCACEAPNCQRVLGLCMFDWFDILSEAVEKCIPFQVRHMFSLPVCQSVGINVHWTYFLDVLITCQIFPSEQILMEWSFGVPFQNNIWQLLIGVRYDLFRGTSLTIDPLGNLLYSLFVKWTQYKAISLEVLYCYIGTHFNKVNAVNHAFYGLM